MALLKKLPTFEDNRGSLTVIEKEIPFKIKRIYYLYKLKNQRGGHRHNKNIQAIICLNGMCMFDFNLDLVSNKHRHLGGGTDNSLAIRGLLWLSLPSNFL